MSKISLKIVLAISFFLMLVTLIFYFGYFHNFNGKLKTLDENEKQKALEIINKSFSVDVSSVRFGKVFASSGDFVFVEVKNGTKENYFLVDLKEEKIIK